jgi:RNA 2',3'-cyclic 3'-phosphodiesterase
MRLFVGVGVGDEMRTAASSVRRAIDMQLGRLHGEPPRVVWVLPAALHITLRFLGEQPDALVPSLVEALQEPFSVAPFSIRWHGLSAFPSVRRPRAIWVGVGDGAGPLGRIESELARRFGMLLPGERPEQAKPFHPHLTLGRVKTDHPRADWPAILEAAAFGEIRSAVTCVSLYRSQGLPGGAGYEEIGRGWLEGRQ